MIEPCPLWRHLNTPCFALNDQLDLETFETLGSPSFEGPSLEHFGQ